MKLTAERVTEIFDNCQNGEVEVQTFGPLVKFNQAKLDEHRKEILELLNELPDGFKKSGGGGWSFLNACYDKHDNQWTGFHAIMLQLFALGQAIGVVDYVLPKEFWASLPGGMPYYVFDDMEVVNESN